MAFTQRKNFRVLASWCAFDWAVTPFHSVILTFVFSVYFSRSIYGDEIAGSAAWANAAGWAGLAIALASPLAGAIADRTGRRKPWILSLTLFNIVATAMLWFSAPGPAHITETLLLVVAATIAAELAIVFYNAMLPGLTAPDKLGRLSGWGWAMGYLGGIVALALVLVALVLPEHPWFSIGKNGSANIRATALLVALWAIAFAWPLFVFVPEEKRDKTDNPTRGRIGDSLRQLLSTLRALPAERDLMWVLIASALYRDGLNTLFAVGGQYAAGTFGMGFEDILIFAIGMNVTSGAGSIAFGFLDDRIGSKRTIILALLGILLTGAGLTLLTAKAWFIPVALVLGLFIGPAQSSARALVARLAPPGKITEIFGLYQFAGKSVAFLGPFAFAAAVSATHNQRWGLASILCFIAAGLGFMLKVRNQFNTKEII